MTYSALAGLRRGLTAALAGGLMLVAGLLPRPADAQVFDPETFTLDNGLEVVVVTNRMAPVVSHMLWYKVGAADEPAGQSGLAHVLEHLMFRGTETYEPGEISRIVARNGGEDNAFTSWDYTAYWQNVAADRLELVMGLEADRMANLVLADDEVANERMVVVEERRQRIDNDPSSRLSEQMFAALYQNHPYGRPIIGWEREIEAITTEELRAFYEHWYAPNNAVLIVSGDVEVDEVRRLAEQTYGQVAARDVPERTRPQEPGYDPQVRVTVSAPEVQQPLWRRFHPAPSYRMAEGSQPYALQVLDEILGAGSTSRLYRALVIDQGLAVGAGSSYSANGLDESIFAFYATPAPDTAIADIETALEAEVRRLIEDGVTDAELASAKERLTIQAVYARDSLRSATYSFGQALTTGQTIEDVESWPERIRAVTAEEVVAAAEAVLEPERAVTGVLLPEPAPATTEVN
ncbi:MAG: insulinase family protein [Gammaproteobacteria bacterium]|jgi:zinc protease|nr:insulinase family protein [Gammaproteobacteria bacterium]